MGIGPIIFGHRALEGLEIFRIVFRSSVMSPQRAANDQKAGKQDEKYRQLRSHMTPPEVSGMTGMRQSDEAMLRRELSLESSRRTPRVYHCGSLLIISRQAAA